MLARQSAATLSLPHQQNGLLLLLLLLPSPLSPLHVQLSWLCTPVSNARKLVTPRNPVISAHEKTVRPPTPTPVTCCVDCTGFGCAGMLATTTCLHSNTQLTLCIWDKLGCRVAVHLLL
jgi:hypothetical protein